MSSSPDIIKNSLKNSKILVTGCTGFVGSQLVASLKQALVDSTIVGIARREKAEVKELKGLDAYYSVDLFSKDSVIKLITEVRPDIVIHLASQRFGSLKQVLDGNVVATEYLLEAMREKMGPEKRVVIIGSSAEIGYCSPEDLPLAENTACQPVDPYGISKLAQSMMAHAAYLRHQQNIIRLRLFNLIGPGLPDTLLSGRCTKLLTAMADGEPLKTLEFGDLTTLRDYTDIRDVSRAILMALRQGKAGRLYHIGSGQKTSGKEIIELLIQESGLGVKYETTKNRSQFSVPEQAADTTLAKQELDWTASITLKQSVVDMWRSGENYR